MIVKEVARSISRPLGDMEMLAKANTPKRSGAARSSVSSSVTTEGPIVKASIGGGSYDAFYFRFLEHGTAAYVVPKLRKKGKAWALLKIGGAFVKGKFQIPARPGRNIIRNAVMAGLPRFLTAAGAGAARGSAKTLRRAVR